MGSGCCHHDSPYIKGPRPRSALLRTLPGRAAQPCAAPWPCLCAALWDPGSSPLGAALAGALCGWPAAALEAALVAAASGLALDPPEGSVLLPCSALASAGASGAAQAAALAEASLAAQEAAMEAAQAVALVGV